MIDSLHIAIAKMVADYKNKLESEEIDVIISHTLSLSCMVIEDLIKEGKLKLC